MSERSGDPREAGLDATIQIPENKSTFIKATFILVTWWQCPTCNLLFITL
jgi:hypothetical protein